MSHRHLSSFEENLVELVHFISFGTELEHGLTHKEVRDFLVRPIKRKQGRNALECLADEGPAFIEEIRIHLGQIPTY